MKKSVYLICTLCLFTTIWQACETEKETIPGSVYGVVADKATGEPIKSAGVELSPSGLKTITGSEGQFEFTKLDPGKYTLFVTKTGYLNGVSNTIEVKPGQQAKGDVQIEKLPPALKVVDDNRQEISTLDFGSAEDDVARSFSLFNDGTELLKWQITITADWIKDVSQTKGEIAAGKTQSLIITIDRTLLNSGENKTTVHITSNSGNKQLIVIAKNDYTTTVLNTYPTTDVRSTSATFNGEIITDGTPKYTERGFVYAKESKPTIDNCIAQLTCPLTDEKAYSIPVSNLIEGTNYYVRAYAVQAGKTVYSSNEVSFVATGNALAKVITKPVSKIIRAEGKATLLGEITDVGDPAYTERGFVYSTTPTPSTATGTKIQVAGNTIGEYSDIASSLLVGKIYYVRAYAINKVGVAYGEEQVADLTPLPPTVQTNEVSAISPDAASATFNATITDTGDPIYTERGFVYSKSQTPTTGNATKVTVSGTGEGNYSKTETGLDVNCMYYVRAFVIYSGGTVYGEEKSFTIKKLSVPTVTTTSPTDVAYTSATVGGNVTSDGAGTVSERGVCYSTSANPTTSDNVEKSGSGVGNYTVDLYGLSDGTTYYVRAYAINEKGISYGEEKSFTTLQYGKPTVLTSSVSDVSYVSATVNCEVTADGGATITERGVCYSTSANPTTSDNVEKSGSGVGNYTVDLYGLSDGTTYYVRAYAINEKGTSYGEELSFQTYAFGKPTVTTTTPTNITYTSAVVGGNVTADGGATVTERGICYSSSTSTPTISDNVESSDSGLGHFALNLTGLTPSTTYYVRAYAVNAEGISYGKSINFKTSTPPTNGKENGHEYVELGLSVKWATCNLGANTPSDAGGYYRFGELTPKTSSSGRYEGCPAYSISNDAAYNNWGGRWRLPTASEAEELANNCTWTWTSINGMNGYQVVGKNGNSIFIPAAGYMYESSYNVTYYGENGFYWTSTVKNAGSTWYRLLFYKDSGVMESCNTWGNPEYGSYAHPIRPVCP